MVGMLVSFVTKLFLPKFFLPWRYEMWWACWTPMKFFLPWQVESCFRVRPGPYLPGKYPRAGGWLVRVPPRPPNPVFESCPALPLKDFNRRTNPRFALGLPEYGARPLEGFYCFPPSHLGVLFVLPTPVLYEASPGIGALLQPGCNKALARRDTCGQIPQ